MSQRGELGLVLAGGGARGSYQAGVLRAIGRHCPDLSPDIISGMSAGAINAAYMAARAEPMPERTQGLAELWAGLEVENVFRTDFPNLFGKVSKWGRSLVSGGNSEPIQGLVDTTPLQDVITMALGSTAGRIPGLKANLADGDLKAFCLTTTCYTTAQTVTWVQGRELRGWDRPSRRAIQAQLTIRHVMASASIPMFFPAVRIRRQWYGDGQIRMSTPFSPVVHLGADRILAIGTRYNRTVAEALERNSDGYPPPAQIIGVLMNSMFLDFFEHDAAHLGRINELLARSAEASRFRPIQTLIIRPSQDLGRIANEYEAELPRAFRFLTRGMGTRDVRTNDALSMVMFQSNYTKRLIEIGEADAEAQMEEISAFVAR